MTIHLTDLSDLIPYEVALTGLYAAITGRTITAALSADDMREAIESRFAALEALREACDGTDAVVYIENYAAITEATYGDYEALYVADIRAVAQTVREALHALSHAPDATQSALL